MISLGGQCWLKFWSCSLVKILRLKFAQDFEAEFWWLGFGQAFRMKLWCDIELVELLKALNPWVRWAFSYVYHKEELKLFCPSVLHHHVLPDVCKSTISWTDQTLWISSALLPGAWTSLRISCQHHNFPRNRSDDWAFFLYLWKNADNFFGSFDLWVPISNFTKINIR